MIKTKAIRYILCALCLVSLFLSLQPAQAQGQSGDILDAFYVAKGTKGAEGYWVAVFLTPETGNEVAEYYPIDVFTKERVEDIWKDNSALVSRNRYYEIKERAEELRKAGQIERIVKEYPELKVPYTPGGQKIWVSHLSQAQRGQPQGQGSITDIGGSFIGVAEGIFISFGIQPPLSTIISIALVVGVVFLIFLTLLKDFDIPQKFRMPIYLAFIAVLFVIGILPIWIIGIVMIVGLIFVFWRTIMGTGG